MWSFAFTLTFVVKFMLKGVLMQVGEGAREYVAAKIDKEFIGE